MKNHSLNELEALVKQVLSGDTIIVTHPEKPIEKTITIAGISAPRFARKDKEEEPFAFQAREFIRKKCIGKLVKITVLQTNTQTGRDYCIVKVNEDEDLATLLLENGLAKLTLKKNNEALQKAEDEAKQNKKGVWADENTKKKNTLNISWSDKVAVELFEKHKTQSLSVIVEQVLSGTSLKVLIGTSVVSVHLSGVQSPPSKIEKKKDGEVVKKDTPLSKESKHYTEKTLLNRDVTLILEGVDKFENLFGSIVLSSNKSFQEELLSQGLATIAEWNVGSSKFAQGMRKAEQEAKKKKLKVFKNYEAPKSSLNENDKKQQQALVVQVLSGDSLRVRYTDGTEERIFLSSITAPKFNKTVKDNKDKKDKKETKETTETETKETKEKENKESKTYYELFAFESKEFLRKKLAENNNIVTVKVDYKKVNQNDKKKEERKFATVTSGKKNISFELVQNGLASVSKHSNNEERSPVYDKLFKFDQTAKEQKKGRYETSSKELKSATESYSLNDLTFSKENQDESQKMFASIKDRKTPAIIDKVLGGSRLKLILPKHNALIIFNISGLSTNVGGSDKQKDEKQLKLTEESLVYTIKNIGNKDVDVLIDRMDKGGNFLGQIFIGEENYSEKLLSEGLAYINHNIANRFKNYNDLVKAETSAKNDKKKFFSLSEEKLYGMDSKSKKIEKEKVNKDVIPSKSSEPFSIRVTEFVDPSHFYLQTPEAAEGLENIEKIFEELNLDENNKAHSPNNGELCICKFSQDGNWYRGKCVSSNKDKDSFVIFYIDYGNKEVTTSSNIRKIDEKLTKIPILAKEAFLAYVTLHKEKFRNEAMEYVKEFCDGNELLAKHEYTIGNRVYLTILDENNSRTNLNSDLIRNGLSFFETRSDIISNNTFEKQVRQLSKDEEDAKKDRQYLWEDGDIYGSFSDDE